MATNQRGISPVRSQTVPSDSMNTPPIRSAYTLLIWSITARPNAASPRSPSTASSARDREQTADDGHRGEHHRNEQQSAAERDGREEPIFEVAESIPNDADEPEERDARERHQGHRDTDTRASRAVPVDRHVGVGVERRTQENQACPEEQGEVHPGDRGCPRRAQLSIRRRVRTVHPSSPDATVRG